MYAGFNPEFKVYQQNQYVATGGETELLLKGTYENILFKNGSYVAPTNYSISATTGNIVIPTSATAGDKYMVVNLSTWHAADTYSRAEIVDLTTFGGGITNQTIAANGDVVTTESKIKKLIATANRTGVTIANGVRSGQCLHLIAGSSFTVTLSGSVSWGVGGAPVVGTTSGNVQSINLVYDGTGWVETCRSVKA